MLKGPPSPILRDSPFDGGVCGEGGQFGDGPLGTAEVGPLHITEPKGVPPETPPGSEGEGGPGMATDDAAEPSPINGRILLPAPDGGLGIPRPKAFMWFGAEKPGGGKGGPGRPPPAP